MKGKGMTLSGDVAVGSHTTSPGVVSVEGRNRATEAGRKEDTGKEAREQEEHEVEGRGVRRNVRT